MVIQNRVSLWDCSRSAMSVEGGTLGMRMRENENTCPKTVEFRYRMRDWTNARISVLDWMECERKISSC